LSESVSSESSCIRIDCFILSCLESACVGPTPSSSLLNFAEDSSDDEEDAEDEVDDEEDE
jgi:hypothetical protein